MAANTYLTLFASNKRFVAFGFTMALASSFGQTYFIGVFGPSLQAEFGLSHTGWGTIYLLGTLASALLLPWSGKQIDRVDLPRYTLVVALLLAAACAFMSAAVTGVVSLTIAIFLLRQAGQGLASHVAVTSMTRYFQDNRGRAIAVATTGFAAGEALLPFAAVFLVDAFGWRWSYAGIAMVLALGFAPILMWLLRGHGHRHRAHLASAQRDAPKDDGSVSRAPRSWTRAEVVGDPRFYLLLPGMLAPPLIITALFFHHLSIATAKGWSHTWITGNYVVFAASSTVVALGCGPLIDRYGARRIVPVMLLPMAAGLAVLACFEHPMTAPLYLALVGASVGIAHTAVAALWAELYGVTHIGAIRSMLSALAVFASALGPVTAGALMDGGVSTRKVLLLFSAYALLGAALVVLALRRRST